MLKDALILVGRKGGASMKVLSEIPDVNSSAVSERHDFLTSDDFDQPVPDEFWTGNQK